MQYKWSRYLMQQIVALWMAWSFHKEIPRDLDCFGDEILQPVSNTWLPLHLSRSRRPTERFCIELGFYSRVRCFLSLPRWSWSNVRPFSSPWFWQLLRFWLLEDIVCLNQSFSIRVAIRSRLKLDIADQGKSPSCWSLCGATPRSSQPHPHPITYCAHAHWNCWET